MSDNILKLLEGNCLKEAREAVLGMNYVDLAQLLSEMPQDKLLMVFRMLPKETAAEVFSVMESTEQQYIVESITDEEVSTILDKLFLDDTVDFIEEMPANVVKKVLKNTDEKTRRLINQLLQYPEDSAGSLMTTEFVDLKREMTVGGALEHIRKTGMDKETIDTCYVITAQRKLEGTVSIRTLILNIPEVFISDIMDTNVKFVRTLDDQEDTAALFKKYDLLSMPVVDKENRLVGIITIDDVMDVIEQENTEDFHKMAAMTPSETPYLKTSVLVLAKNRILWLLLLMISATLTGYIIRHYENALAQVVALTSYIPVLMDTGGNAGSQSSTMIIRALALSELRFRDITPVIWKEFRVGVVTGAMLALVNFGRIMLFDHVNALVALTVCCALFCIVILAKVTGGMLPMLAQKLHMDPVIMASPLITTVVDALSLVIYFTFATYFLGIA